MGTPPAGPAVGSISARTGVDPGIIHQVVTDGDAADPGEVYDARLRAIERASFGQYLRERQSMYINR